MSLKIPGGVEFASMSEEPTLSVREPEDEARPYPRRQRVGEAWGKDALAAVLAAALALLTYGATLLPGAGYSGDVAKFQFVGWSLGTPHATGYPAWMLASCAFTRLLPVGTIAWRANLLSAIFAAAAVAVVFLLVRRCLGASRLVAVGMALLFAFGSLWWSQAIVAEVYSLHGLCLAASIGLLLRWQTKKDFRLLAGAAAVVGLSVANHITTLIVLPALVGFVLWVDRRVLKGRRTLALLPAVVVPAVLYLYPFWRTLAPTTTYLEMQTPDLETFLWYLGGAQFRDRVFAFSLAEIILHRVPMLAAWLWSQAGPFVIVLAGLGVVVLGDLKRHLLLGGVFVLTATFALGYDIPDIAVYFLPCWLMMIVYAGVATAWLERRFAGRGTGVVLAVTAAIMGSAWVGHWPEVDLSNHRDEVEWAERLLAAVPERCVVLTGDYTGYEVLQVFVQTGQTGGKEVHLVPPLVSPAAREHIDSFVAQHDPPPLIRRQAARAIGPEGVQRYLEGTGDLELFEERRTVPQGLPVVAVGEAQRKVLATAGLATVPYLEDLWWVKRSVDYH